VILTSLVSILASAILLFVLGRHDPKRLRNHHPFASGDAMPSMSLRLRRLIAWLVPAPGLVLAMLGQWWAFLVWLGAVCALGWITAQLLANRSPHGVQ
jgi:hypothetical protein